jgi:hypothetical protein
MEKTIHVDHPRAVLHGLAIRIARHDGLGHHVDAPYRAVASPPDGDLRLLAHLPLERIDGSEGQAVDVDDLVADQEARTLGREAGEHAGDECLSFDAAREDADARIGYVVRRRAPFQRAPIGRQDRDEIVVGRVGGRVEAQV